MTLTGNQRYRRVELFQIRASLSNRPSLKKTELSFSFFRLQHGNRIFNFEFTRLDPDHLSGYAGRHHNSMFNDGIFLHDTNNVSALEHVTDGTSRLKVQIFSRSSEEADFLLRGNLLFFSKSRKRALDTVKNLLQHSRSELHRQRGSRRVDFLTGADSRRLFIDLDQALSSRTQ